MLLKEADQSQLHNDIIFFGPRRWEGGMGRDRQLTFRCSTFESFSLIDHHRRTMDLIAPQCPRKISNIIISAKQPSSQPDEFQVGNFCAHFRYQKKNEFFDGAEHESEKAGANGWRASGGGQQSRRGGARGQRPHLGWMHEDVEEKEATTRRCCCSLQGAAYIFRLA